MKKTKLLFPVLCLLSSLSASASQKEFLEEINKIAIAESATAAINALTNAPASSLTKRERNERTLLLARLNLRTGDYAKSKEIIEGVIRSGESPAEDMIGTIKAFSSSGKFSRYARQRTLELARDSRSFKAKDRNRAELLKALAVIYRDRCFCDLAAAALDDAVQSAAKCDPGYLAGILFLAAENAQIMRDKSLARDCLKKIQAIPSVPYSTAKEAMLREGMNEILRNEFEWRPTAESLARAEELIMKAIDSKPSAIKIPDAFKAREALMKAYHRAGKLDKAIEIGQSIVDAKYKSGTINVMPTALYLAGVLVEAKKYKLAVRYYEKGTPGKETHLKIAVAARLGGDYVRAIQAYTDALPYCDWVEGKDEIANIKHKAAILSKASRDKAKAPSSDDLFNEDSEDITNLQLDEF